jgi:sec-independent protein translocase protein TatA
MFASPWKDGLIILVILLLFFGPKRLPALSRAIGESVKEFKGGITEGAQPDDEKPEISAADSTQPVVPRSETAEPTGTGAQSHNP